MEFFKVPTLQDFAVIKVAVEICNHSNVKREILCAPGSLNEKLHFPDKKWKETVVKSSVIVIQNLGLLKELEEKVAGLVIPIGMKMLKWTKCHERRYKFYRSYLVDFMNSSLFTSRGLIDSRRAAEKLAKDDHLDICQRYKLACEHFLEEAENQEEYNAKFCAYHLFEKMTDKQKQEMYDSPFEDYQELIHTWTRKLRDGILIVVGADDEYCDYWVQIALDFENEIAYRYCWKKLSWEYREETVVKKAVSVADSKGNLLSWTPELKKFSRDYGMDGLCFLLSEMREDQQVNFFKVLCQSSEYLELFKQGILEYFLEWPYQDYFMEAAKLMWEFLPEEHFANLLVCIIQKMDDDQSYDYSLLFNEFWCQSPLRYKRYVLSDYFMLDNILLGFLSLKNFATENKWNIERLLTHATLEEKEYILSAGGDEGLTELQRERLPFVYAICTVHREL